MSKGKPRYRSKLEERVANNLRNRRIPFDYEPFSVPYEQPVRNYKCPECGSKVVVKERRYTPDIVLKNGIWIEVKGRLTSPDRTKMVAIKEFYPDQEIKLLLMRDNYLTKNKATRYSEWCERNGFDYVIGERVPSEWVE